MPSDLRKVLAEGAVEPRIPLDLDGLWRSARRRLRLMQAGALTLVIVAAGSGYVLVHDTSAGIGRHTAPAATASPGYAIGAERVGIFAIHAMGAAGLRDQDGTYADYRATTSAGETWVSHFGPPMDCNHSVVQVRPGPDGESYDETTVEGWSCDDLSDETIDLEIAESDGRYSVTSVDGPLDQATKDDLLAYEEDAAPLTPEFEVSDAQLTIDQDGTTAHGSVLWTGVAKDLHLQECALQIVDDNGAVAASMDYIPGFDDQYAGKSDKAWIKEALNNGGVSADSQRDSQFHVSITQKKIDTGQVRLDCHPVDVAAEEDKQAAREARAAAERADACRQPAVDCIDVEGSPSVAVAGDEGVWVFNTTGAKGWSATRIDPDTNEVLAEISIGAHVDAAAAGLGSVWAVIEQGNGDGSLVRIDPSTNTLVGVPVPVLGLHNIGNYYMAVGEGGVWITSADGALQRYDPASGQMTTFHFASSFKDYSRDSGALRVAAGGGYVWLADTSGVIVRITPGAVDATPFADVGYNVRDMKFASGKLWLTQATPRGRNQLVYVDVASSEVHVTDLLQAIAGPLAVGEDGVWVLQEDFSLRDSAELVRIALGDGTKDEHTVNLATSDFAGIAAGGRYVWVTGEQIVYRVTADS